jgi:uncharacterized repeat protein (TIGR04042 family)
MPEMHFVVEWPDGERQRCYSPSYVVEEHVAPGESYAVDDFVSRVARALGVASERVQARYGFACSSAMDQLAVIRGKGATLSSEAYQGRVTVLSFEKHPPRDARKDPKSEGGA